MTEKDLVELIDALKRQKCEKQYVEVKKALGGTSKKLYDTLSSFSNQNDGGTIIFGVDELAEYKVIVTFFLPKIAVIQGFPAFFPDMKN